jgi:hypothetical protein
MTVAVAAVLALTCRVCSVVAVAVSVAVALAVSLV